MARKSKFAMPPEYPDLFEALELGDAHGLIIRGAILMEASLYQKIAERIPNNHAFERLDLSFEQLLWFAVALDFMDERAIKPFLSFHRLRNKFAHQRNLRLDLNITKSLHSSVRKLDLDNFLNHEQERFYEAGLSSSKRYRDAPCIEQLFQMTHFLISGIKGIDGN
tara:strand:- start:19 stop:516 length:498 start_codon:yes stop_codon:yes gene_type:complete